MKPIIRISNLSKEYQLAERRASYGTLRDAVAQAMRTPFKRLRNRNGRDRDKFWALRGIEFDVAPGEVCGIVGRNGAGKSTLLKILSRITEPTTGRVELFGRVGSLLEVGTGFHPELSGRENIYLNGAILGMRRSEIVNKFDEIVAFSEIERFIDSPVKFYSSGMYMRLAFAVAAHLEPEILLVDEVLAVGDAAFQKKCLGKMGEVASKGRTVLFVSHNMASIGKLCTRAILLEDGCIIRAGKTQDVVSEYLKPGSGGVGEVAWPDPQRAPGNDKVRMQAVRITSGGKVSSEVKIDQEVSIEVDFTNYVKGIRNLCVSINLIDSAGVTVLSSGNTPAANLIEDDWFQQNHEPGQFRSVCTIPANFLNEGVYYITVYILKLGPTLVEAEAQTVLSFTVVDTGAMREPGASGRWDGVVRVRLPWQTRLLKTDNGSGN